MPRWKSPKDRYKRVAWIVETAVSLRIRRVLGTLEMAITLLAASENGDKWIPVAHHPLR